MRRVRRRGGRMDVQREIPDHRLDVQSGRPVPADGILIRHLHQFRRGDEFKVQPPLERHQIGGEVRRDVQRYR